MPLGNLTSQFFANVYLNEFDYFVKNDLRAKFYIRYVDDFVIFHDSKKQLEVWITKTNKFLSERLNVKLHPDKSRIISMQRGVDFVGFRNFSFHRLLRRRNVNAMRNKIKSYKKEKISFEDLFESFKGWRAYAKWGSNHKLIERLKMEIIDILWERC